MSCATANHSRNGQLRARGLDHVVRHPDVSYCDECLYQIAAADRAECSPWGDISVERAAGVCTRCKQQTTVSTGRRTGSLADFAAPANAASGEGTAAGPPKENGCRINTSAEGPEERDHTRSESRVMDLVMQALLLAKRDALRRARASLDEQLNEIESEIGGPAC